MSWNPIALWFLLLIPPIVLLYLLKMRREPTQVASTMLWEQVLSDLQANTPFQRLRANLQLILQLLMVLLLVAALADLFVRGTARQGRTIVAVLDASASMKSRDGRPTRFDEAKERLLEVVAQMGPQDEMMVLLAAGGSVRTQQNFTRSAADLRRFISKQQPTDMLSGVREALLLAVASIKPRLERSGRSAEILLLSDGALDSLVELDQIQYPIRFLGCGKRGDNLAITALHVRRLPYTIRRYAVFVEVTNFDDRPRQCYLSLGEGFEGGEISSRKLELPPGKSVGKTFKLRIRPGPINVAIDARDDLALDNRAVTFIQAPRRLKVLVATPGNLYLRKALWADEMTEIAEQGPRLGAATGYDLVICDGFVPPKMPDCPVLMIAPPLDRLQGVRPGPRFKHARITHTNRSHPYTRYLQLDDVEILQTETLELSSGRGLAFIDNAPVIGLLTNRPYEDVVIGFRLSRSTWPMRASWPIFVFNILERIRELKHRAREQTYQPGQTVPLEPGGAKGLRVTRPSSEQVELSGEGQTRYFHQTDRVGVYQVEADGKKSRFAVNLLSHAESRTAPRDKLDLGNRQIARRKQTQEVRKPLWRWFALAALAALMLEWWVFHRKIG